MKPTLDLDGIAHEMKATQDQGKQIELLSARVNEFDNTAAYEVARSIHQARMREGASPVGRRSVLPIATCQPEIVLHFGSAPPVSNEPTDILACIDWIAHGIEIVRRVRFGKTQRTLAGSAGGRQVCGRCLPVIRWTEGSIRRAG